MVIIVVITSSALFISSLALFAWSVRRERRMRLQGRLPERLIWRIEGYILVFILFLFALLVDFVVLHFPARALFQLALLMIGLGPFVAAFAAADIYWGIKRNVFMKLFPSTARTTTKRLEDAAFLFMFLVGGFLLMVGLNLVGHWVGITYFPLK
jgi:hypothetical protein